MLAMQYDFVLPADYDMAIIRRRIADKGHLLDDFSGLAFKAYAHASRADAEWPSRDNHYAPFYLWHDIEGMNAFLGGAGFAGLAANFGRPSVRTWSVWHAEMDDNLRTASCATRDLVAITPDADLGALGAAETESARAARAQGALAAVCAFDPYQWSLLRFRLWPEPHDAHASSERQHYRVGHVSQPRPHRPTP